MFNNDNVNKLQKERKKILKLFYNILIYMSIVFMTVCTKIYVFIFQFDA